MNNLSLYCGLFHAKIGASDKGLPVMNAIHLEVAKWGYTALCRSTTTSRLLGRGSWEEEKASKACCQQKDSEDSRS